MKTPDQIAASAADHIYGKRDLILQPDLWDEAFAIILAAIKEATKDLQDDLVKALNALNKVMESRAAQANDSIDHPGWYDPDQGEDVLGYSLEQEKRRPTKPVPTDIRASAGALGQPAPAHTVPFRRGRPFRSDE